MLLSKPRLPSAIPLVRLKPAVAAAPTTTATTMPSAVGANERDTSPTATASSNPPSNDDETSWASLPPPVLPRREPRSRVRTTLGTGLPGSPSEPPKANAAPSIAQELGIENFRDAQRRRYNRPRRGDEAPDVGPWLARLRAATDRDDAVRLACEAASELGRAAVFLVLRRGVLRGWDAVGPEVSREGVANLWIPASSASIFRSAIIDGRVFVGPVGTSAADQVYRAAIGSRGGRTAVYPVIVAGKAAAVLTVDEIAFGDVGPARLGSIADGAGTALERLVIDGKSRSDP
jgi:hypothetical protein